MSLYRTPLFLAVSLVCVLCVAEVKADSAPAKPVRTDAYGDPLPPGALLRLGTMRWRTCAHFLAFTPDGKTLATGERDRPESMVRFWDVATGKETGHFPLQGMIMGFWLSPDGKTLAVDVPDVLHVIRLVSVPEGKELRQIEYPAQYTRYLCFSPDGKLLAGIDGEEIVRVWDAANGKEILCVKKNADDYDVRLAISPDSKRLSLGYRSGSLRVLEVATGKVVFEQKLSNGAARQAIRADFSPDGKRLLWLENGPYTFALRDAFTGAPVLSFKAPAALTQPAAFSPNGKRIASIDEDNSVPAKIGLWDAATGKELRTLTALGASLWDAEPIFSPDSKRLAVAGRDIGVLHVWNEETGKDLSQIDEHQSIVCSVAFSPDGRTVLTGCADQIVRLWDADKGIVTRRIQVGGWDHDPYDYHVVFSNDRKLAAVISQGTNACLWDLDSGKQRAELNGGELPRWRVAFAPDGKTLASKDERKKDIHFWDTTTGKKVSRKIVDDGHGAFAISPDGKTLVVERNGAELTLWNLALGEEIRKWSLPNGGRNKVLFAPSGSMIAGAGEEGISLWDKATGTALPALRIAKDAPNGSMNCLAFSHNGRTLAAAGGTGVIYLWEVDTAKVRAVLTGHRNRITALDFSPDGSRLISGSWDATALIWDLTGIADETDAKSLTSERLTVLWDELAAADAGKAWRAGWRLTADPAASVTFLQKHVRPAEVDVARIAKLLAALDGDAFEERETASRELTKLGDLAGPAERKALEANPSGEARRRLEELLNKLNGPVTIPEQARDLRCVEVLEHIGSAQARRLLDVLSKGAEGSRLTRDAKAALERLAQRKENMP